MDVNGPPTLGMVIDSLAELYGQHLALNQKDVEQTLPYLYQPDTLAFMFLLLGSVIGPILLGMTDIVALTSSGYWYLCPLAM